MAMERSECARQVTTGLDDRGRIARDFWLQQAERHEPLLAVNPGGRCIAVHDWTRRALQRWTLARMRAFKPRYSRCLDVGCGYGDWTEQFATLADEVYGCELASGFVEQALRRVPSARITCADLRDYELPPRLDLVYIGAVLMYLPEPDALDLLRRIRAALVPDALVVCREYCTFNLGRRTVHHTADRFSIHRSPDELCWLAELAGLQVVEIRSAPSIYGEVLGGRAGRWPMRGLLRLVTLPWRRASHTFVLRP